MSMESKSIKVHPALEQTMIEQYQDFGWTLVSSQEVFSQTSHSDEDAVFVYHYTTTTNFIKLMFQREREFANREQILALEDEYWACYNVYMSVPKIIPGKWFWIWAVLMCFAPIYFLITQGISSLGDGLPALIVGLAPMILRHICYYLPKKKKGAQCLLRCVEIDEEVKQLRKS